MVDTKEWELQNNVGREAAASYCTARVANRPFYTGIYVIITLVIAISTLWHLAPGVI